MNINGSVNINNDDIEASRNLSRDPSSPVSDTSSTMDIYNTADEVKKE